MADADAQQPQQPNAVQPVHHTPAMIDRRRRRQQRRRQLARERLLGLPVEDEGLEDQDMPEDMPEDMPDGHQRGLNDVQMALLPVDAVPIEQLPDICAICHENVVKGEMHMRLPCLHAFHETCAKRWLSRRVTCPQCCHNIANECRVEVNDIKLPPN